MGRVVGILLTILLIVFLPLGVRIRREKQITNDMLQAECDKEACRMGMKKELEPEDYERIMKLSEKLPDTMGAYLEVGHRILIPDDEGNLLFSDYEITYSDELYEKLADGESVKLYSGDYFRITLKNPAGKNGGSSGIAWIR